ncbi:hypothetical protein [Micromonospora sp. CA-244673]|uniref:hypothetical protein n=1 Tax=Micromonospora sp. CA-244673 TaxID=3239958 RepID=UPI003D8C79DB
MAMTVVAGSAVAAVSLHHGGEAAHARLPLAFGAHLAAYRRRNDPDPVAPCVTAITAPTLPPRGRLVRLPHLLTVRRNGRLFDAAVWEVMREEQARGWLGGKLPDTRAFEDRLPRLLRLRQLARAGQLPPSPETERLTSLLATRYMSIRMVYRHPELFNALVGMVETRQVDEERHDDGNNDGER